jgi:hypothetical protein
LKDISSKDIEMITKDALQKALEQNANNRLRSSVFVSNLGLNLYEICNDATEDLKLKVVGFDKNTGKKVKGEWLLDIAITKSKEIFDSGNKQSKAIIDLGLFWAAESESNTGLPSFADDFGKLLCVKSDYYLYLNGLDQLQPKSRESFIDRRLELANEILNETKLSYKKFFFAFWPSPKKNQAKGKSFWDIHQKDDLLNMVKVFEL